METHQTSPPLRKPLPTLNGPFQPGIADPQWPIATPDGADAERYAIERAGRISPQSFVTVLAIDIAVSRRQDLADVLRATSDFAGREMNRPPLKWNLPLGEEVPETYRVTVTIGFGSSLFMTPEGNDRFQLNHARPRWLRTMPTVRGDEFNPTTEATDLLMVIASDHPYVNVAIARSVVHGYVDKRLLVRRIEQGFSRPDKREFLRFDDGIDNISNANEGELDKLVFVQGMDEEPQWCVNGSYLAWRKIRENLPMWEGMSVPQQEGAIGRHKQTGLPLSRVRTGTGDMVPVYPSPIDPTDGPLAAHIRKVQPRRPGVDLFGTSDLERRFLRRAYPFFDGLDSAHSVRCGLLFLAFMRNLRKQFEWPVQMWQTNPDFPLKDTGIDTLYAKKILSNIAGGYYFCPPAPQANNFVGSGMFSGTR